jgi:hypothetical protein
MDKNVFTPLCACSIPEQEITEKASHKPLESDLARSFHDGRMSVLAHISQPSIIDFLNNEALRLSR